MLMKIQSYDLCFYEGNCGENNGYEMKELDYVFMILMVIIYQRLGSYEV